MVVNGPVWLLIFGPMAAFIFCMERGIVAPAYTWIGVPVLFADIAVAWLWWSLSIPKWRLWSYQRVDDIAQLKARAVGVGLTWPDNHLFERTEIKSRAHAQMERELDTTRDGDGAEG